MKKTYNDLTPAEQQTVREEFDDAHDFDRHDPLFSLRQSELEGPRLSRRAALRLFAAAGALTTAHLMPGIGLRDASAQGKRGGHLRCGWANVGEIRTLDPAKMNQVLQ